MLNILLSGACGRMGHAVISAAADKHNICAGVDGVIGENTDFPLYKKFSEVVEKVDVIIDFSNHLLTCELLEYAVSKNIPCVIATTGHTEPEKSYIKACAEKIPVFYTGNMSLGINVLCNLASSAAKLLGEGFDIEIIEKHHRNKLDAPSGTALMIANELSEAVSYDAQYVYDRTQRRAVRANNEIGISSIRGGSIVGEHEVLFCGKSEVISIKHIAEDRGVFAEGAIAAAEFISDKTSGIYSMKELLLDAAKCNV